MQNKKSQGISMNVIIISAISLLVLVILIAIFAGRMETENDQEKEPVYEWNQRDICMGYGNDETNAILSSSEIQLAHYIRYLYDNPDANINQINLIVNEQNTEILNLTYSRVKYTVDGKQHEVIDDIIYECKEIVRVYKKELVE